MAIVHTEKELADIYYDIIKGIIEREVPHKRSSDGLEAPVPYTKDELRVVLSNFDEELRTPNLATYPKLREILRVFYSGEPSKAHLLVDELLWNDYYELFSVAAYFWEVEVYASEEDYDDFHNDCFDINNSKLDEIDEEDAFSFTVFALERQITNVEILQYNARNSELDLEKVIKLMQDTYLQ